MASSADFLFGEDLEAILSLTESDSFDESLESASMVTETSSELQNLRLLSARKSPNHSRRQEGYSFIFHQNSTKKIYTLLVMTLS